MRLHFLAPHIEARPCSHCLEWWYDEKTGKIVQAGGKDVKRYAANPPPCRNPQMPDGCPKGTPEDQKTLTAENAEAYWHWQQCKAVGQFPNDEIVMRNAGIIQQEVDRLERERHENLMLMLSIPRG